MWVLVVIIGIMMTVFIKFLEKINFRKKNVESKESPYVVNVEKEEIFKPLDTKSEV